MRVLAAFVSAAILMGAGGAAQAAEQIYGAGPLYGGGSSPGGVATCRIYNFTLGTVTVNLAQITNNQNVTTGSFDSDSCGFDRGNVVPGSTRNCAFGVNIPGKLAYSCRVRVVGTDPRISGVLEIQKSQQVLSVVPLSPMK